ncbi:MAG: 30S ribosomal protein S9 [Caldisericota bacterium]|nr:30S ribosomal protein S9 [Caldisericota bacterium]
MEKEIYAATGRRKTAVARVRLIPGSGEAKINGKPAGEYFSVKAIMNSMFLPLKATDTEGKFDILVNVVGGGFSSQADAVKHGIARALLLFDETLRATLKKEGFLTRDARKKERKKYGLHRARKARQYRKR